MSKNNCNSNGAGPSGQPTIHLILQGKGGVGKSGHRKLVSRISGQAPDSVCAV